MRWLRTGQQRDKHGPELLEPVRIFTAELELKGFVAPTGQRVTDILVRGQDLAFLPAGADAEPANWLLISPADVLVVIPPPISSRSEWQVSAELTGVFVEVGPYRVTGTAHVPSGQQLDDEFRRRQPFLPLTGATIAREGAMAEPADVAIVNLGAGSRLQRTA